MKDTIFIINRTGDNTAEFAASELAEYLGRAGITVCRGGNAFPAGFPAELLSVISLEEMPGVKGMRDLDGDGPAESKKAGISDERGGTYRCSEPAEGKNAELPDAYTIDITDLHGVIRGINARSILIGCYRFLKEIGYAFLRPDPEGERIPEKIRPHRVFIEEKAKHKYRGICIEGAVSFENIIRLVRWMPKAGFNIYFTQFLTPYEFFKTWYEHVNNPGYPDKRRITPQEVDRFVEDILVPEMKKRGLLWQAAGHGFQTETFGLRGLGWDVQEDAFGLRTEWMARINGARGLFHGIPMNTNLCYSKQEVRLAFAGHVVSYCRRHPGVDHLHVWLADDGNNSCECEACREKLPSEWYIELLNLIDRELTKENLAVRIVFLAYFDLLWPPQKETLHHPDRFIFMFAPITRSYRRALSVSEETELSRYERNRNQFPASGQENMRYAQAWGAYFKGDSFIYDYHYMWNHFQDWGDYYSAKVLYEDIAALKENGFDGYVSCQQTRVFAPSGFGMYVMGRCLWGCEETFEELLEEYFDALYGERGGKIREYVRLLSEYSYWRQPEDQTLSDISAAKDLGESIKMIEEYLPVFEAYEKDTDHTDQLRWKYLLYSAKSAWYYCVMLKYKREGNDEKAGESYREMKKFLCETESAWQEGMDLYWFIKKYDSLFF